MIWNRLDLKRLIIVVESVSIEVINLISLVGIDLYEVKKTIENITSKLGSISFGHYGGGEKHGCSRET